MQDREIQEVHNPDKLKNKLVELRKLRREIYPGDLYMTPQHKEVILWIEFRIHQWENGVWGLVNTNKKPPGSHPMSYYEPVMKKDWIPSPINFNTFMDWKIKNLTK